MAKEKKKKHWIKILAPKEFDFKVLGETIVSESKSLIGKKLDVNLFVITGDIKKQSTSLGFVVIDAKEGQANTELYKYFISTSHLRRLVKNSKDKIEDSFTAETKDKVKVKMKPIMITRRKTSKSILTNLRRASRDFLTKHLSKIDFTEFVKEVVFNRVQNKLKYNLKVIYPLGLYELKTVEKIR